MALFLNIIELAQSLGVEESEVDGWIRKDGLPHITDRGRLLFDRAQVVTWAESHGLAAKVGFLAPDRTTTQGEKKLEAMLRLGSIWRDVAAANAPNLFAEIVAKLPGATPPIRQILQQRLRTPNGISWAPVGGGLALPHLSTPIALGRDAGIFAIVLLRDALVVGEPAPDHQPITRLLFFVAPSPRAHLEILARLSKALARGHLGSLIHAGASDETLFAAVADIETTCQKEGGT